MSVHSVTRPLFFLLVLFLGIALNAQEYSTKIDGRVYSKEGDVAATHVTNTTRNRGTITDISGFFTITARLNDTLVFSAVQFKKKEVIVTSEILKHKKLEVVLEDALTKLNEVVVTPYDLTGDLNRDAERLKIKPIMTASTLGLPHAYLRVKTQNERKLLEAKDGAYIKPQNVNIPLGEGVGIEFPTGIAINVKRILNDLSGRTKTLKTRIAIDRNIIILNRVKRVYHDSIYEQELKIPEDRINDFMNYCAVDSLYNEVVDSNDILRLWDFLKKRSSVYRKNNNMD